MKIQFIKCLLPCNKKGRVILCQYCTLEDVQMTLAEVTLELCMVDSKRRCPDDLRERLANKLGLEGEQRRA